MLYLSFLFGLMFFLIVFLVIFGMSTIVFFFNDYKNDVEKIFITIGLMILFSSSCGLLFYVSGAFEAENSKLKQERVSREEGKCWKQ